MFPTEILTAEEHVHNCLVIRPRESSTNAFELKNELIEAFLDIMPSHMPNTFRIKTSATTTFCEPVQQCSVHGSTQGMVL